MRRRVFAGLVGALVIVAVVLGLRGCMPEDPVVVVAAGDMACDLTDPAQQDPAQREARDECRAAEVSDLAVAMRPEALLGLGDYQYEVPATAAWEQVYGPTWGRLREVTVPALGNQEYKVHAANTYRSYFGDRVGSDTGYWSTDVGSWHVVVLDSNCTVVEGGCVRGSPQQRWLEEDLAGSSARCTVALLHHPRWSTGLAGSDDRTGDLVATLVDHRVELLLSGHEADYERFAPQDAQGRRDPSGITQLVVGTGGQAHYPADEGEAARRAGGEGAASVAFDGDHHGVLRLVLGTDQWSSEFHALGPPEAPQSSVLDRASGSCS